jgi:hypothetical protein
MMKLTLPEPLKKLRDDWIAENALLEEAKKLPESGDKAQPSAEILEKAVPSIGPADAGIRTLIGGWTAAGAGGGLLLSLALGLFLKRSADTRSQPVPVREFQQS